MSNRQFFDAEILTSLSARIKSCQIIDIDQEPATSAGYDRYPIDRPIMAGGSKTHQDVNAKRLRDEVTSESDNEPSPKRVRERQGSGSKDNELAAIAVNNIGASERDCSTQLLSIAEVNTLMSKVEKDRNDIIEWISNTKMSDGKKKVSKALQSFSDTINKICQAYIERAATDSCRNVLNDACNRLERAVENLPTLSQQAPNMSYANVAGPNNQSASQANTRSENHSRKFSAKIKLDHSTTVPIKKSSLIVIGPQEKNQGKFVNSEAIREALFKNVNPAQLNINVKRVHLTKTKTIMLETDSSEETAIAALKVTAGLQKAGLEIKNRPRMKPRLIIHDIPVDLEKEEIVELLHKQNAPNSDVENFKAVYLYPPGRKSFRSCVIEVTPEIRNQLIVKKKIHINWSSCRFADHVSLVQCFKCAKFDHVADKCNAAARCGTCAEEHTTKDCSETSKSCCPNCTDAGLEETEHSAFDKIKCTILRTKIERKTNRIQYG